MTVAIHMARPDQGLIPNNWVVLVKTTQCLNCGREHKQTTVTGKTWNRSPMTGKIFPNQRPVRDPNEVAYNLPIEQQNWPLERIPFCHECFEQVSLSHLPLPPAQTPRVIIGSGLETTKQVKTKTPAKPFTIDDL